MSTKKRILFIAQEMSPYLELSDYAAMVNKMAIKSNEAGLEVRVIMPRFGIINERRHRLHEVVRLSGINIVIDGDDYPLIIKVASLPNARLQVYFLDNEDYFKRKTVFADENDEFFDDNAARAVFFFHCFFFHLANTILARKRCCILYRKMEFFCGFCFWKFVVKM